MSSPLLMIGLCLAVFVLYLCCFLNGSWVGVIWSKPLVWLCCRSIICFLSDMGLAFKLTLA